MDSMKLQTGPPPRGRVFYNGADSFYPGWHLQYYEGSDLRTVRLHIQEIEAVIVALIEAAGLLGCDREQVQLHGDEWPSNVIDAD